jgi:hypothetical protein
MNGRASSGFNDVVLTWVRRATDLQNPDVGLRFVSLV